jgi:hypothetical protein
MNAQTPSSSSVYREIASAIGAVSARRLIEALGGQRLYIPAAIDADHEIAKAIGTEPAESLASFFHGTWMSLPMPRSIIGPRAVRELAQREPELTRAQIALRTGYTERQVYRILGENDPQGQLFSEDS